MQIKHHPFTYDVRSNLFHKTFLHPPLFLVHQRICGVMKLALFCISVSPLQKIGIIFSKIKYSDIICFFFFNQISENKKRRSSFFFLDKSVDHLSLSLYPLEIETFASFDHSIYLQPSLLLSFKNVYTFSSVN